MNRTLLISQFYTALSGEGYHLNEGACHEAPEVDGELGVNGLGELGVKVQRLRALRGPPILVDHLLVLPAARRRLIPILNPKTKTLNYSPNHLRGCCVARQSDTPDMFSRLLCAHIYFRGKIDLTAMQMSSQEHGS